MKHGYLPGFTEQRELMEMVDDSGNDVQNETDFAEFDNYEIASEYEAEGKPGEFIAGRT